MISCCHLTDVLMDFCRFILDSGSECVCLCMYILNKISLTNLDAGLVVVNYLQLAAILTYP